MTNKIQDIIEENEKEFGERFYWEELFGKNSKAEKVAKDFLKQSQLRLLEGVGEMIEELPEKPANLTPQQQSGYEIGIMAVLSLLPETKCTQKRVEEIVEEFWRKFPALSKTPRTHLIGGEDIDNMAIAGWLKETLTQALSQREEEVRMEMVEKIKNLAVDEMFAEQVKVAVLQTLTTKDK